MTQDPKQIERYRGIIKFLGNTVRNIALYPPEHPSVKGVSKRVFDFLGEIFEAKEDVLIGVINGVLYVDDYQFYETTPYSDNILKVLTGFGIDDLLISQGVTENELLKLAGIFKVKERSKETFLRLVEQEKLTHIGLKSFKMGQDEGDLPAKSLETYKNAVSTMTGFFSEVEEGQLPSLREAENLVEGLMDKLVSSKSLLMLLSGLKGYDAYTYQHSVNVGILALLLAEKEGLDEQHIRWAALAGLMHDVGKVRVPPEIINKPGGLTLREWVAVKTHPLHSADVIRGMGGAQELMQAVEGHHRNYDGGGYPIKPDAEGPTKLARLISVVDVYDAMTSVRAYKKPVLPVEAMKLLGDDRGTMFDPQHVDAFISMVGAYPPGTMVRLSSNEIGMVVKAGDQPGKPTVKMVVDEKGQPFAQEQDLDLSGAEVHGRVITSVVDPVLYGLSVEMAFA
jgi:putative nucleotidyltransferase with HDIG domain